MFVSQIKTILTKLRYFFQWTTMNVECILRRKKIEKNIVIQFDGSIVIQTWICCY